jgi:hypothetical protein
MKRRRLNDYFTAFADWVSSAMGTPLNIGLWAFAVGYWFLIFAVDPNLQNTSFMPSWFTSNAFNFPLNTVTTLAELFIGFLIAAAANRVEKRNRELHEQMKAMLAHIETLVGAEEKEIRQLIPIKKSTPARRKLKVRRE